MGFPYSKSIIFVLMKNFRGKIICLPLQLLTLIIFPVAASAQSTKELKEIFAQAESYYLYEEYDLANQLYIIMENPENLSLSYKIGTCYLNIPDEKEKAIPYLEAAVKNAVYDAKAGSFKERRAPLDAYFYLGKAYMVNNQLEKGLSTLQTFANLARDLEGKGKMENLEFVDQQMLACKNAIMFEENPVPLTKKTLGPGFSEGSMNENPAVSFDGNTIAYTERRGLVNVILFSKKVRGKWQNPVEITDQLNAGEDCSTCALNEDGTELYLYKTDMFDGNIYSSRYVGDKWTPIVKLNKNINTKFYESHAAVSADGKRLFFTSNRDGGQGGLDIYVSEKDAEGEWGVPVNLGKAVNTPYNEDNPFIIANDSALYFCSEGHNSMGGYDNFKSTRLGNEWKKPESLGYPVNTTDDDKFFQPSNNGMTAYYSMKTDYKKRDIFYIGLGGVDVNQIYEIAGNFRLNDTAFAPNKNYNIHILSRTSGDTLYRSSPDKASGLYSISVAPGSFRIAYSGDGYITQTIDTTIIQDNPDLLINLDVTLEPVVYEKINLAAIPVVLEIDSSILIRNMLVSNVDDVIDSDILYYTVQVMALYNPVDVSYFKRIDDMKVMYSEVDRFYRYTTGRFATREEAAAHIKELKRKGYPDDIFIKKVSK
jgi:tetratricopeptide (TPR) repeat protein